MSGCMELSTNLDGSPQDVHDGVARYLSEVIALGARMRPEGLLREYQKLVSSHSGLMERFSPFSVGDRVEISAPPTITSTESWGWLGYKHFLVKGSPGEVRSVDFTDGFFVFGVKFDLESARENSGPHKGHLFKSSAQHTFWLSEDQLTKSDKSFWRIFESEDSAPTWVTGILGGGV